jgi:hypothetical protein
LGVFFKSHVEVAFGFLKTGFGNLIPVEPTFQVSLKGFGIDGTGRNEAGFFLWREFEFNLTSDGLSNVGLKGEDIAEITVVLLGPERPLGSSGNESSSDADSIAGLQDRPFNDSINIEFASDFAHGERSVLELHYGLAGDDTEIGALAELRDEFFSNAIGEEFAIGIAGKVGERKNSNGLNARCAGDESGAKTTVAEKEGGGGERREEEKGSEKSEERFAAEKGVRWSGSKRGERDSVGRGIALQAPKINGEFLCGLIAVGRILFETLGDDKKDNFELNWRGGMGGRWSMASSNLPLGSSVNGR